MRPIDTDFVMDLRAELQHRGHGTTGGFALLEPNPYGCPAEPYTNEAFAFWEQARVVVGDNPEILHHLAIMHHARAIDLEHGSEPALSDEDWRTADRLWAGLCGMDRFWTGLAAFARVDSSLVEEVRRDLAERCVRMHLAIAFEDRLSEAAASLDRRRFHLDLAVSSPFPAEVVERERADAYARQVAGIQPQAWDESCLEQEPLDGAITTVRAYLDVDPGYLPALRDLSSFLVRRQTCYVQEMNSLEALLGPRNAAYYSCVQQSAVHDTGAVGYLEPILERFEELPQSQQYPVLQSLVLWFDRLGMACGNLERYDEAIMYYDRAIAFAEQNDYDNLKEMTELREERMTALIEHAAHLCHPTDARERQLLERRKAEIAAEPDPPPSARLMRARFFHRNGELDRARDDALAVLGQADAGGIPAEDVPEVERLLEMIEVAQVVRILDGPVGSGDWQDVLAVLAATPRRSHPSLAFLGIQACVALGRVDEARARYRELELGQEEPPDPARALLLRQAEQLLESSFARTGSIGEGASRADVGGDPSDDARRLDELVAAEPKNVETYVMRSRCRARAGDGLGALSDLVSAERIARERGDPVLLERINGLLRALDSRAPPPGDDGGDGRW